MRPRRRKQRTLQTACRVLADGLGAPVLDAGLSWRGAPAGLRGEEGCCRHAACGVPPSEHCQRLLDHPLNENLLPKGADRGNVADDAENDRAHSIPGQQLGSEQLTPCAAAALQLS
jgi:hypothetical protein